MDAERAGERPNTPPLGYLLRQAAAAHRLVMERALADTGITPPQFLIMTLIAIHPGCSNADLARLASLTTPTVTVILNNLSGQNVFHTAQHPADKRVKLLTLSDTGRELLARCRDRAAIAEAGLAASLGEAEARIIATWLIEAARLGSGTADETGGPVAGAPAD